jgi:hypothetical protein
MDSLSLDHAKSLATFLSSTVESDYFFWGFIGMNKQYWKKDHGTCGREADKLAAGSRGYYLETGGRG